MKQNRPAAALAGILLGCVLGACTGPVRPEKPETWVRGSSRDVSPPIRRGFQELLLYHPEPYEKLNTSVLITAFRDSPSGVIDRYLRGVQRDRSDVEVIRPISATDFNGHPSEVLEVNYWIEPPTGANGVVANNRMWVVPRRSGFVSVFAQQPVPPDPRCHEELESAIRSIQVQ
jgi:hypothetical protein